MATAVPSEFLFAADPGASRVVAFKINADGGLSSVPGSPFEAADSPQFAATVGNHLLVAGKRTLTAFAVNKETGAISQTDVLALPSISDLVAEPSSATVFAAVANGQVAIRVVNNKFQAAPASEAALRGAPSGDAVSRRQAAIDATGKFFYVLDGKGFVSVFQLQSGKPVPLSPSSYPVGEGASSIIVAVP